MVETLLYSAAFSIASGLVYLLVGNVVQRRKITERHALANDMFSTWWYTLGASTIIGGLLAVLAYGGFRDITVHFTLALLNAFLICVGLLGLLYYMIYVFTGARRIMPGLIVGYLLYYFLLVYYLLASKPVGVRTSGWQTGIEYENQSQGLLFAIVLILLIVPQILAALALFGLSFRLEAPEQKFRTRVVSASFIIWFGSALVAAGTELSQNPTWQVVSRFLGLGAALAIFFAYRPPTWLLRRWEPESRTSDAEPPPAMKARAASAMSRPVSRSSPSGTAS